MASDLPLEYTQEGTCTAVILVVGPRGGGKTTIMAALAPLLAPPDRLWITSPVRKLGNKLGLPTEVRYGSSKDNEEYFGHFLSAGKHGVLVIDEFDEFCPGGVQGKYGGYCCDALYRIVNYGRNDPWCLGLLASFRGASDVTTNLLRAANVLFVGRTTEPNALDYFQHYIGREYGQLLPKLPPYVFVVFAEGRIYGYVKANASTNTIEWVEPPKGWPTGEVVAESQPASASSAEAGIEPQNGELPQDMSPASAQPVSADQRSPKG